MRRRSKRGPNDSESTGKIGQELPANQLAPLRPAYPEAGGAVPTPPSTVQPAAALPPPAQPAGESKAGAEGKAEKSDRQRSSRGGRRRRGGSGRGPKPPANLQASPEREHALPHGESQATGQQTLGSGSGDEDDLRDEPDEPEAGSDQDAGEGAAFGSLENEAGSMSPGSAKLVLETQPDSQSTPPPAPQPAGGPRQPRGFVVLTIGLPGSGKTTWFKRRSVTPLSSDMLRGILFDDITEQRYQGLVFSTLRSLLRARLIAKMPWNYVDATNLSPHERRQWIKMAKSFGYDVQAVFFDVPFDVCMERNRRRERVVSDEAMAQMNERLRSPSFKEGFSKITVVRVKGVAGSMPPGGLQAGAEPDDSYASPSGNEAFEPGDDGPDESGF